MKYLRLIVGSLILASLLHLSVGPTAVHASGFSAFVHTATASNTTRNETVIDNELVNGNADAILLVTQNWNPGGVGGTYNNHSVAVKYNGTRWVIYNYDLSALPVGAAFNVAVIPDAGQGFQRASTGNVGPNYILFDHTLLNGNPDALAIATLHNFGPPSTRTPFTSPIGLWYSTADGRWSGYTEARQPVPSGMGFNVAAFATTIGLLHTSTAANTVNNWTYIDFPAANGNPNAKIWVTHNWNPGGAGTGTYLAKELGVWYNDAVGKWAIFTQDRSAFPLNLKFNVMVG